MIRPTPRPALHPAGRLAGLPVLIAPLAPAGPAASQGAEGAAIAPPEIARERAPGAAAGEREPLPPRGASPDGAGGEAPPARLELELEAVEVSIGRLRVAVTLDEARADELAQALREAAEAVGADPPGE